MIAEFTDAMPFFLIVSEVYDKVIWPFGDLGMNERGDYFVCKKTPQFGMQALNFSLFIHSCTVYLWEVLGNIVINENVKI